jgi:hypothetical protein
MNLVSVRQALEAASPGRFFADLYQDQQSVFITVRLIGAANLFVPKFCRKLVIGASVPAALTNLLDSIEDERVHATMCDMDLADFVVTSQRTTARPFEQAN